MESRSETPAVPKAQLWTGYVLSFVPGLMLVLDGVMKLIKPEPVIKATTEMGYPANTITGMGLAVLVSAIIYLFPRTAVLGAILLTGYLGGAVATHVRHEDGWVTILAPAIFGAVLWLGLYLRDPRLRALVPWRS
jgi:hypothetical protein